MPALASPHAGRETTARHRWLTRLSWVNLIGVLLATALIKFVSEEWWVTAALVYLPRCVFIVPSLLLVPMAATRSFRATAINLAGVAVVVWPLMNLRFQFPNDRHLHAPQKDRSLRIVSCNVQRFRPDFASVLGDISQMHPSVIALQDADALSNLLERYLAGWHAAREGEFVVASRFPVRFVDKCRPDVFGRTSVARFALDTPAGLVQIYNLHQMTPRRGLTALRPNSIITETGRGDLEAFVALRAAEARETRDFFERTRGDAPALIVGDFNMPSDSSLYREYWPGLANAFDEVGTGYGYTFPCQRQYQWPAGFPWLRIDHILVSEHWSLRESWVGSANGSDHRPIAAIVELR
jgi:endonuclease/exonuclease/phosphatase (EEP) superfamily protein YafD